MTFPLFAVGVSTSRLSEIRDLGFTAARSFEVAVSPEEFVSECRENGLEAMSRTNGATWWVTLPDEPKPWILSQRENVNYDATRIRMIVARNAIPICYVPGHYQDNHVRQVAACKTEVMLGSYGRLNNYPPQFTLWRPSCLTGELRCVALNCEHGDWLKFRWDIYATLAMGAKAIAIYKPHVAFPIGDSIKSSPTPMLEWLRFVDFVTRNDRLLRSGVRTVQSVGSEMYDAYQIKNKDGTVVCTVPPQPRDQLVTWRLGYEWCSVRVNGDEIETKNWRGMA